MTSQSEKTQKKCGIKLHFAQEMTTIPLKSPGEQFQLVGIGRLRNWNDRITKI